MFEVGQYVVFGNKGVCQVLNVGPIDMPGIPEDKMYYTLSQVYQRSSTLYTPVDKENSPIRPILSKKDAKKLMDIIKEMDPEWNPNDKVRNQIYTEILRKADSRELGEMIIALDKRKKERIASGKKPTSTDEKFFHAAADIFFGELGIALEIDKDEVKSIIIES